MAKRSMGMVSPNRAQVPQYSPMVRQGSLYNLTFDEVQSQLGNTGKPLHSMNLDELHKNVISAESGQLVQDPSSDHSFILGNIGLNGTLSNKTNISEAWRGIVHQEHVNRSVDTPLQQPCLGETTTLENFLARAGVINVGDQDNVNVIGDTQALMGIDPMVLPSQREHWLQMQVPSINIHQHQEQQHQQIIGSCADFNVSKTFYENPVMEIGYSENSVGISMSPAYSDSKSAVFGKNRYSDEVLEKTIERRQKRMAKNRESAARSRAKKQVSTKTHQACMRKGKGKENEQKLPNEPDHSICLNEAQCVLQLKRIYYSLQNNNESFMFLMDSDRVVPADSTAHNRKEACLLRTVRKD
ncbi:ABSCISIC ACID-INSENSITIVE 5 protein 3 [Spatholobus suberectus]|nr:ABSCISIC ACID-INSENSITIVE 5 protein 3 [Spatholobus suberectus]